jgi:hypothetical protein
MDKIILEEKIKESKHSCYKSHVLKIMNELDNENIYESEYNVIKLVCKRSFHDWFSIKIEWQDDEFIGVFVLNRVPMFTLKEENYIHYEKQINKGHLDNMLNILQKYKDYENIVLTERHGFDGADWTMEIKINGKYKKFVTWSPDNGIVYELGNYLIKLSKINLGPIY